MRAIAAVQLLLVLGVGGLLGVAQWRGQPNNETRIARGAEMVFADFGFAVERTTLADRLGPPDHDVEASGRYVCVDLRVLNHMQAGDYAFRDGAALLVDGQGRTFRVDAAATRAARGGDPTGTAIPPGGSGVIQLVFDVPDDATGLRMRFDLGSPIENLLEAAFDGQRSLALE
jgi:hypothetical protein